MPSGSVTRSTFFGSPSGSMTTAATTGWPDSIRPSLPVKQICLALGSGGRPGTLALDAEFRPGRIDQVDLLFAVGQPRQGLQLPAGRPAGRPARGADAFGAAFGLAFGAPGAGALRVNGRNQRSGSQHGRRQQGESPPTRPDRRGQDTEIHCGKPFLNGAPKPPQAPDTWPFGRLSPRQMRRLSDRPCRLGLLHRLHTVTDEKINGGKHLFRACHLPIGCLC